jgi:hypothetical protein
MFSFARRRHHCRNCVYPFCHSCSTRQIPLPQRGYISNVRVCDSCFIAQDFANYLAMYETQIVLSVYYYVYPFNLVTLNLVTQVFMFIE